MASHLERLRRELEDAIGGADYIALQRGPAGKWNSAQILEHLYTSYKSTNVGLTKCLEKGAPLATSSTLKQWRDGLLVVDIGYMPNGIQAPKQAIPRGLPPDEVRSNILGRSRRWSQHWPTASAGSALEQRLWIILSSVRSPQTSGANFTTSTAVTTQSKSAGGSLADEELLNR
ncbi:MAG: hypothetical protein WBV46_13420 [Terriglobales bacterium]|jgi:hypothetical protein